MNARAQAMIGMDTHKHTFSAGVVASDGTDIGVESFPNSLAGCEELQAWLKTELDIEIVRVGIEGSGGWGRHVAGWLVAHGYDVREVPSSRTAQRRNRRRRPKTDHEDALAIARETLADPALGPARAAMDVPESVE